MPFPPAGNPPERSGKLPEPSGTFPQTLGTIPQTPGSVPGTLGTVPGTLGTVPEAPGTFPRTFGNIPEHVQVKTGAIPRFKNYFKQENKMSRRKDYIPSTDADFNTFFKSICQYVNTKCGGTTPEWTQIPKEERDKLDQAYIDWYSAYGLTLKPHSTDVTKEKNRVREVTEKILRTFVQRFLRYPPVTDQDRDIMGVHNPDTTRTYHFDVKELVEFEIRLRAIRELDVRFWIKGASHKAKPQGYDGAVIIWDILDAKPANPEDLTRHSMASRSPHTLHFKESERGKTVYIALAWQNDRGHVGAWSEIEAAIIP